MDIEVAKYLIITTVAIIVLWILWKLDIRMGKATFLVTVVLIALLSAYVAVYYEIEERILFWVLLIYVILLILIILVSKWLSMKSTTAAYG